GQAPAEGVAGVQAPAGQDDLQGPLQPDDARQALGAAPGGQQPQLDLGQPDLGGGLVEDQAVVAGQGQLQPAAQAGPVDDGDGGHGQARQLVEVALAHLRQGDGVVGGGDRQELVEVGPGEEARLLAAGDDEEGQLPLGQDR